MRQDWSWARSAKQYVGLEELMLAQRRHEMVRS